MQGNKTSVAHLTSVHSRYDARILLKECRSLAKSKYNVTLVVADGKGDELKDGVLITSVPNQHGRISRLLLSPWQVYKKALEVNADIYHLHDPELLPIGLKLKREGKIVIFDAHEDFPLQLLNKHYANKWVLKLLSFFAQRFEVYACSRLDGIVAATPAIAHKFSSINRNTVSVNNYPVLDEVVSTKARAEVSRSFCYVGGIGIKRGILEAMQALNYCPDDTKLILAGSCTSKDLQLKISQMPEWEQVEYVGYLDRDGVCDVYRRSVAGLVALHPIQNYLEALPVKMFEYMGAGLPVIASNIPLWVDIVEKERCGFCVDPYSPEEIAKAVSFFISNPTEARAMGEKGRKAVLSKYNWGLEEEKLIDFYRKTWS
ncbi:glycosyltransferase family 4 protein [Halopseudomonas pertucinogena]|uniref:Glycosyltransferase WbpH n=1 Tax=Halopseudomonas pertucinogena TaxID=86175 RepID=A0ABQ2CNC7_9GAMM|nr:glycosyltransferase family 4 protein [Halopseudomonas pertucinogena]GGI96893.1 glycosyltransferase WbpH [Halopseudomonas pertucinogena]